MSRMPRSARSRPRSTCAVDLFNFYNVLCPSDRRQRYHANVRPDQKWEGENDFNAVGKCYLMYGLNVPPILGQRGWISEVHHLKIIDLSSGTKQEDMSTSAICLSSSIILLYMQCFWVSYASWRLVLIIRNAYTAPCPSGLI